MGKSLPVVVVIGRPNVGKSTFFNRVLRRRQAIVADFPGVTRDRIEGVAEWRGRRFLLVDTGGMEGPEEPVVLKRSKGREKAVPELLLAAEGQAREAMSAADLVLFMVDGREGLTPADEEVARALRRSGRPVLLMVNKIDSGSLEDRVHEFHALGLGEPIAVSAEHGVNVGDLLDRVVTMLPPRDEGETLIPEEPEEIRVCIAGRPNVGKSSLLNRLVGEERAIVSDVPGTTREAVDAVWQMGGRRFLLVDTAGLRRRARVDSAVEYYGNLRTFRSIDNCNVALLILDATGPITDQDKKIAGYIQDKGRACIIVINKWDVMEEGQGTTEHFSEKVRNELPFIPYTPLLFVSALTGLGLSRLPGLVEKVAANHARRLETSGLNRLIVDAQRIHQPPGRKGRSLKIYYATQVSDRPPTLAFFVNDPELVHYSYERFLENRIRQAWNLEGTPVRLRFRRRRK